MNRERTLTLIRKLLRMREDQGCTPAEATTATEKINQLLNLLAMDILNGLIQEVRREKRGGRKS